MKLNIWSTEIYATIYLNKINRHSNIQCRVKWKMSLACPPIVVLHIIWRIPSKFHVDLEIRRGKAVNLCDSVYSSRTRKRMPWNLGWNVAWWIWDFRSIRIASNAATYDAIVCRSLNKTMDIFCPTAKTRNLFGYLFMCVVYMTTETPRPAKHYFQFSFFFFL